MYTTFDNYETAVGPHLNLLNRWVKRRVPKSEDAEDIVQETLLLALRHFGQFRFESSFGTWLCRIAINVIRGRIRRPDYQRTVFTDPAFMDTLGATDASRSPLAILEQSQSAGRLHAAISQLPDIYRVIIELRDLKCLSIEETSEALGLSRPAIKSRHHRARLHLLDLLTPSGYDPTRKGRRAGCSRSAAQYVDRDNE